jgi:23S rRNA pseudouridine1911/1915/1917 synthase
LLQRYPDTPKTRAKQWIVAGRVTLNGVPVRKPHVRMPDPGNTLQLGDRHAHSIASESGWQIHPRVALLFLDGAVGILNKGPGLISVPAPNADLSALSILADFLAGKLRPPRSGHGQILPAPYRKLQPLSVHRLDQYTSGVFCAAMNPRARQHLIAQVRAHSMKRAYIAFAEGRSAQRQGTWRDWLSLSRDELSQRVISLAEARKEGSQAMEAVTHFEVVGEYPLPGGRGFVTKLRLRLETGLKHQIRAQAAHAGLPLIGDRTYHAKYRDNASEVALIPFSRQALHAESLTLEHPNRPGEQMTWTAPLPPDLRELEAAVTSPGHPRPRPKVDPR